MNQQKEFRISKRGIRQVRIIGTKTWKKRCSVEGCAKSAVGKTDKCIEHGGGKRCSVDGCTKSAVGKTDKCKAHGGGKRCSVEGCTKSAVGKSDKCVEHGGGKRCPHCIDWPDSQSGWNKYDGYCARCFKRVFPSDPRSKVIRSKSKEIKVRNMINQYFDGFIHDKCLYTGNCKCVHRRRIDHYKIIGLTMLAIETDEFAHRSYDEKDEEIRYNDLMMVFTGKWVWIRFNPDDNRDKTPFKKKLVRLREEIEREIERITLEKNDELVEIKKLFY